MLRRLHKEQPDAFAFTPANDAWAAGQISKYPEGRQASAVIPLLWRAQEQDGWLSRPAIEHVAAMLDLAYIRVLEVATFYFMFQLQPVGSVANIQVCGTTSCMICGAEDLVAVCKKKIAPKAHMLSKDGKFSWEEVECLGACANAPMAQIGKDYYEDLTADRLGQIIDEMSAGKVPVPGPQNGRYAAEPMGGLTTLKDHEAGKAKYNASAQRAVDFSDTIKRIDGREEPLTTPWLHSDTEKKAPPPVEESIEPQAAMPLVESSRNTREPVPTPAPELAETNREAEKAEAASKEADADVIETAPATEGETPTIGNVAQSRPAGLSEARDGGADDLKRIKGVGPKMEDLLNSLGFYHFDQIAAWGADEVAWVDDNLEGFKGRVSRDNWVSQAAQLATGAETEFSKRVDDGDVY
ncbi:NADH-quinone oxidoreductase subunit E [Rhodobacteraceae bacterium]|nr:NADH-quinone oxidoreductase subunit E [Paracoccaceae bacterium]